MFSTVRNFLITFFVSLIIFAVIAYFVVTFVFDEMAQPDKEIFNPSEPSDTLNSGSADDPSDPASDALLETEEPDETIEGTEPVVPIEKPDLSSIQGNSFTALLIGTDYRPDYLSDYDLKEENKHIEGFPKPERPVCADSLLLIKVDKENGRIMLSSIPNNMKVMLDGVDEMLGSLYNTRGAEFIKNKVTALTGINIDYYAVTHIQDFSNIIDSIGGVYFDVPVDMYYEDTTENLKISIPKGSTLLDGDTAEKMLRYCSYSDGNISRMNMTLNFAKAILNKLTSPDYIPQAVSLYNGFSKFVTTNFTETDLIEHMDLIFAYPQMTKVELTYPGKTVYLNLNSVEYFEPDVSAAIKIYNEYR